MYSINTRQRVKEQNLESDSCKNFPSKLTRSTSSLKMGANSQACFQWLSGNAVGNKATGAWTIPTPGTTPDLYTNNMLPHKLEMTYDNLDHCVYTSKNRKPSTKKCTFWTINFNTTEQSETKTSLLYIATTSVLIKFLEFSVCGRKNRGLNCYFRNHQLLFKYPTWLQRTEKSIK